MNFNKRLTKARIHAGLTMKELGELSGVHYTNISHMEGGNRQPSMDTLVRLIKVLRCTSDYLLGFSDELYTVMRNSNRMSELTTCEAAVIEEVISAFLRRSA